jgi:hypothetical protein
MEAPLRRGFFMEGVMSQYEKPVGPVERHFYRPTGELVCPFEEYASALCVWFDLEVLEKAELHRMQLAAIDASSLANTRESAKHRIDRTNPYWTPALQSVYEVVDREMAERERAEALTTEIERIRRLLTIP